MNELHEKYDVQLRRQADEALKHVYADANLVEQCKLVRKRVYEWLEAIAAKCMSPETAIATADVDRIARTREVSPHVVADIIRDYVALHNSRACLVSRQGEEDLQWVPTSFFYDPQVGTLNAKIGSNPYQPIGFDDGTVLVQLEGTKLLWARLWAIAPSMSIPRPFHVEVNLQRDVFVSGAFLDEISIRGLRAAIAELQEELDAFLRAEAADKAEADYRLRETLKLARIHSAVLDSKLKLVLRERSGLGPNFENTDITMVVRAALEYAAARLDSHEAMRRMAQIDLIVVDDATLTAMKGMAARLRQLLLASVVDFDALEALLARITKLYTPAAAKLESIADESPVARAQAFYDWFAAVCATDLPSGHAASAGGATGDTRGAVGRVEAGAEPTVSGI